MVRSCIPTGLVFLAAAAVFAADLVPPPQRLVGVIDEHGARPRELAIVAGGTVAGAAVVRRPTEGPGAPGAVHVAQVPSTFVGLQDDGRRVLVGRFADDNLRVIGSAADPGDIRPSRGIRVEIAETDGGGAAVTVVAELPIDRLPLFAGTPVDSSASDDAPIWYECTSCGYIYDVTEGDSSADVPPGTTVADLPDGWVCPVCEIGKDSLRPVYGSR